MRSAQGAYRENGSRIKDDNFFDEWDEAKYCAYPLDIWDRRDDAEPMDLFSGASVGIHEVLLESSRRHSLNVTNREGWTPLMYACSSRRKHVVQLLLLSGADATFAGDQGLTPLMISARNNSLDIMELLFQHASTNKKFLETRDERGWTALFHAVFMGQKAAVESLILKGANVNAKCFKGQSVLMVAATEQQKLGIVDVLVEAGAFRSYISPLGETALSIALAAGNQHMCKLLEFDDAMDLLLLFSTLGIEKYWNIFNDHNIGLQLFLALQENDLKNLGINLLGPRKKMLLAIAELKYDGDERAANEIGKKVVNLESLKQQCSQQY